MQNLKAATPKDYLDALPADRRKALSKVRSVVKKHLPKGYGEFMSFGMITWGIPLTRYPKTYNGQPIMYAALASQKNFCTLYLMSACGSKEHLARLQAAFEAKGQKLDMGKSCVHFQSADDLPLPEIGALIGSIPAEKWIAIYEESRNRPRRKAR